jgi:HEAT repeat protein
VVWLCVTLSRPERGAPGGHKAARLPFNRYARFCVVAALALPGILGGCVQDGATAKRDADLARMQAEIERLRGEVTQLRSQSPKAESARSDAKDISALVDRLDSNDVIVQYQAARALRRAGDAAMEPLIAAIRSDRSRVKRAAIAILGEMKAKQAAPAIAEAFGKSRDQRDLALMALSLGRIGDRTAVPTLVAGLDDKHWEVQLACARSLSMLHDPSSADALAKLMDSDNEQVRTAAIKALEAIGPDAVPRLDALYRAGEPAQREQVLKALGEIRGTAAEQALVRALDDPNSYLRLVAAFSLGRMGSHYGVEVGRKFLDSKNTRIREMAREILTRAGKTVKVDPTTGAYVETSPTAEGAKP